MSLVKKTWEWNGGEHLSDGVKYEKWVKESGSQRNEGEGERDIGYVSVRN